MLCEKCKKNQATFHYTEVVNGVKNEHHLCGECAAKTDVSYYSSIFDNDMNLTKLLSGLLGNAGVASGTDNDDPALLIECPVCHTTYGDFVRNSSFGCSDCYEVFGPLISGKIKKIQGSSSHIGKAPKNRRRNAEEHENISFKPAQSELDIEIEELHKQLEKAVAKEDFKSAATLRDKIAALRKGDCGND